MANTSKVSVKRHIEQVRDGSHYKGSITIADVRFDYELVFGVPIAKIARMEPPESEDDIRRLFQITVSRGRARIELSKKEEYGFFFAMLVEFAVDFHNLPQTRDSNEGPVGLGLRHKWPTPASISMTSITSCEFSPEIREILSAPRFGCTLATS